MSDRYDVAVIGSGPGGYVAAIRAAQLGANAACIDRGPLGGTCLNRGCIPTKALLEASHLVALARDARRFGIRFDDPEIDFAKLMKRKDSVVRRLSKGVGQLFAQNGVEHVEGTASFVDDHTLQVASPDGSATKLEAAKIIIATGSEPTEIPAFAFDGEKVLSSTHVLNLDARPETILIVGGGYIGCEFACFFAELGTEVHVVEMLDRLLPLGPTDLADLVTRSLKKLKVNVHTGTRVEGLDTSGEGVAVELSDGGTLHAEKALVAVGRKLNSDNVGLENTGVEIGDDHAVVIDEHCRTSVPHIYAIGDVTGKILLAHLASRQGIVAAEHATGEDATIDYHAVPATIFAHPEASYVGLSEAEAKEQGLDARAFTFPIQVLGKAQAMGESNGMVKLVGDNRTGEILGAQVVCTRASNLIGEITAAMQMEGTVEELARTIHVHPTLSEGILEAAEGWLGRGIHYND
ncbi:MAG: dihydrolipoyl dehydrogenase [Planctomycetota bacterium]